MKTLISSFVLMVSITAWATETETPCPAMNQETREKIVEMKTKVSPASKTAIKQ